MQEQRTTRQRLRTEQDKYRFHQENTKLLQLREMNQMISNVAQASKEGSLPKREAGGVLLQVGQMFRPPDFDGYDGYDGFGRLDVRPFQPSLPSSVSANE